MSTRTYRGWTLEPPDHNSTWWTATRPSGKTATNGEPIPEAINAATLRALQRRITARETEETTV